MRLTHWTGGNPGHSAIVVRISRAAVACAVALNDVLHFVHYYCKFLRFHNWPHHRSLRSVGADSDGFNLRPLAVAAANWLQLLQRILPLFSAQKKPHSARALLDDATTEPKTSIRAAFLF